MNNEERVAMEAGAKYGIQMLEQLPKNNTMVLEAHLTGVLCAFWGALWGSMGTEYAKGFIESQLRSMEPGVTTEVYGPGAKH